MGRGANAELQLAGFTRGNGMLYGGRGRSLVRPLPGLVRASASDEQLATLFWSDNDDLSVQAAQGLADRMIAAAADRYARASVIASHLTAQQPVEIRQLFSVGDRFLCFKELGKERYAVLGQPLAESFKTDDGVRRALVPVIAWKSCFGVGPQYQPLLKRLHAMKIGASVIENCLVNGLSRQTIQSHIEFRYVQHVNNRLIDSGLKHPTRIITVLEKESPGLSFLLGNPSNVAWMKACERFSSCMRTSGSDWLAMKQLTESLRDSKQNG
jgi:hypothetical protein